MIHVDLPAVMECTAKDCGATLTIKLALTMAGTLLPRIPQGHGWQIGASSNGAFVCRCPAHHSNIEAPPGAKLDDVLRSAAKH